MKLRLTSIVVSNFDEDIDSFHLLNIYRHEYISQKGLPLRLSQAYRSLGQ